MKSYYSIHGIQIDQQLADFIHDEVLPLVGVDASAYWQGVAKIIEDFAPRNRALLAKRNTLQEQITQYHQAQGVEIEFSQYKQFLTDIGYLEPVPETVSATTSNVDNELAIQAGPQLVVPITNARYALNAANARWGSLYDALYGSDIIADAGSTAKTQGYNPGRGAAVISMVREKLDQHFPLVGASHSDVNAYRIEAGKLLASTDASDAVALVEPTQFAGFIGAEDRPTSVLLKHNQLHIEMQFDESSAIGQSDRSSMSDVIVESALSTIMDCEDSVAVVDAEDKVQAYKNWLGLMKGDLVEQVQKGDRVIERSMNDDRVYNAPNGGNFALKGRSLLFVRNVGHLMTIDAILDQQGDPIPEGILDGVVTSLIGMVDLQSKGRFKNSEKGSIYIVKPKMHGSEEVKFADELFAAIETMLGLEPCTIKMGIMDEERRTSVNLKACINAAAGRVAFINTGFLDRTGDEIHTSMQAGAFLPKAEIKQAVWLDAYERSNVDVGLSCGLKGRAQIGKGMWPIPDQMAEMMKQKIGHPKAGANTAWVPSPTAATLHALHYHDVSVASVQEELEHREPASVDDILQIPLLGNQFSLSDVEIQRELDNNLQGILGYVVRWVELGVGCSKVPDINDVGLMEDRATLRISAQHVCNWLKHGVVTRAQVEDTLLKMASKVDAQNTNDPAYIPMCPNTAESLAFNAAADLVFLGDKQPSGYTEPLLHEYRKKAKARLAELA